MTENITQALDLDRLRIVRRLAEIQAHMADLSSTAESLKAELRNLPAGDYADDQGKPLLRLAPTRSFDAAKALERHIPPSDRAAFLKVEIDAAAVKKHLTIAQIEALMVTSGKPKVVLL